MEEKQRYNLLPNLYMCYVYESIVQRFSFSYMKFTSKRSSTSWTKYTNNKKKLLKSQSQCYTKEHCLIFFIYIEKGRKDRYLYDDPLTLHFSFLQFNGFPNLAFGFLVFNQVKNHFLGRNSIKADIEKL